LASKSRSRLPRSTSRCAPNHFLLTTYYSLPTHHSLLTTYYLLPTTEVVPVTKGDASVYLLLTLTTSPLPTTH